MSTRQNFDEILIKKQSHFLLFQIRNHISYYQAHEYVLIYEMTLCADSIILFYLIKFIGQLQL